MDQSVNVNGSTMPVNVMWTGGWDSTFRVLDLALRQQRRVQPHYVRRDARKSNAHELAAMRAILALVLHRHGPAVAGRIAPLIVAEHAALTIPPTLRQWHRALRQHYPLVPQYLFLHAYALHAGLTDLELGVVRSDSLADFLRPHLVTAGDGLILAAEVRLPALALMRPFRFPLLNLTKTEAGARAETAGFLPEMMLTHFCHRPLPTGAPCGNCYTCVQTAAQGLGWRIPNDDWLPR